MFCSKCGKQIPDNSQFCEHCGSPVGQGTGPLQTGAPLQSSAPLQGSAPPQKSGNGALIGVIIALSSVIVIGIILVLLFVTPGFLKKEEPSDTDKASRKERATEQAETETTAEKTTEATEATEAATEATTEDVIATYIATAKSMSTSDRPNISDVEWFMNSVKWDGVPTDAEVISDYHLLDGGWKAYIEWDPYYKANSHCEYYMNVFIKTVDTDNVTFTVDYWSMSSPDGTYDMSDEGRDIAGSWDENFDLTAMDEMDKFVITDFYYRDGHQFAIGNVMSIDGTEGLVALQRGTGIIEYTPTENFVDYSSNAVDYDFVITEATTEAKTEAPKEPTTQAPKEPATTAPSGPAASGIDTSFVLPAARAYSGANTAEVAGVDGDAVIIHCYDDMGDHTATVNWLTIDPTDYTGYDFYGNYVDLKQYK